MNDLIYRQAAIDVLEERLRVNGHTNVALVSELNRSIGYLMRLPSADVQPVQHGRWETDGMPMDDGEYLMTRCTVCGTAYEYGHNENYCGYCGARMDGE